MQFTQPYYPNEKTIHEIVAGAPGQAWHKVDLNGNDVATTLLAAFPNLDPGAFVGELLVKSVTAANASGGDILVAVNQASVSNDDQGTHVPSGQTLIIPGPINNVWVKKVTAGDEVVLRARW